jgi:Cft2 family RNA processing exonuclease
VTEVCTYGNNVFVSNIATEQMLYTEADLESSMDKIETINFHEEKDVFGIKFWAYNAGHVLGAAMFMIEIAGVKVQTTQDTNSKLKNIKIFLLCFYVG